MSLEAKAAALSIILPADSLGTITPVLNRLRKQTIAPKIEIVLVLPATAHVDLSTDEFAAVRVVEVKSASPLTAARAAGVRAATAPLVFMGETHSFLRPDACEKLVDAAADTRWAVVVPGFENGNPNGVFSWSCFLADYSRWSACLPTAEIRAFPIYNSLFRRALLLELNGSLEHAFAFGDDLQESLDAKRQRVYFAPQAIIEHMNLNRPRDALHEQFLAGLMIGSRRALMWPWWRRLIYVFGSGLIPFVLFRRIAPGLGQVRRRKSLPPFTTAAIWLLMFAKGIGEFLGYLGMTTEADERAMDEYEIRKLDYLR